MDNHERKRTLYLIFGWSQALVGTAFLYTGNYDTAKWTFLTAIMAATIVQKMDIIISMLDWQRFNDELTAEMTLKAVKLERALNEAENKERAECTK